jgi:DNA modification methylase
MKTKEVNIIHKKDARSLDKILNKKIVDVTITSPPYFDLKDYGYQNQIGYGQEYSQYLEDLKLVFQNVYNCTKENGTLWVIIDSFRRENEVIPLPFDVSNKLKDIGWKLQEVIIWVKDKTVPWVHHGQMRNLFEYILVFSKRDKYNFYIDKVRDFHSLKKWWVKWPERYNPKGKAPDGIWHFDIPVQGSWGNGYIKHFCPLPEEMIEQILKISTKEGNLVLDPFAGSGAVLAKADTMNRKYIGFELNSTYIAMFRKYLQNTSATKGPAYDDRSKSEFTPQQFYKLIKDLRALKYVRTLFTKLPIDVTAQIRCVYVERQKGKPVKKNASQTVKYLFVVTKDLKKGILLSQLTEHANKAPLSKFGIETIFEVEKNFENIISRIGGRTQLYTYTTKITHKFNKHVVGAKFLTLQKSNIILSKIKVNLNEKEYE